MQAQNTPATNELQLVILKLDPALVQEYQEFANSVDTSITDVFKLALEHWLEFHKNDVLDIRNKISGTDGYGAIDD